ncbi:MAG TPA: SRPBCC family protein [Polyangiales bacterium]|nr:SRPBCC family protein [Polyangiales bacterium]
MPTFFDTTQVTKPSDHEVKVTRSFKAPRELVYEAYTTPDLLQRWLGGPGWSMPVCEMDVRVGGKFKWLWRSDEGGQEFGFHGEFIEVNAPAKLVNTEHYDAGTFGGDMGDGSLNTTEFIEDKGFTTLTVLMRYKTKQACDAALATGMTDGMEQSYQQLDALLQKR